MEHNTNPSTPLVSHTDWIRFLNALEDLQVFSLCSDFDNLSLEEPSASDTVSEVTPRKFYYPANKLERMRGRLTDHWQRTFIDSLSAPFAPADELIPVAHGIKLGVGFRFTPGQEQFLMRDLMLPSSLDTLRVFSGELGLSYYTAPLNPSDRPGPVHGVSYLVSSNGGNRVLLEVLTDGVGQYGRVLVLVILGVGCTAWFSFVPHGTDLGLSFQPFDSYDSFFQESSSFPGFKKTRFVETENISNTNSIETLIQNPPFTELEIPANGNMLKAVGLGVMVAVFLALGIIPNSALISDSSFWG